MPEAVTCDVCGRSVEQPRTSRRLRHPACKELRDDLERVRRHLEQIAEGTHPTGILPRQVADLRYDLICLLADLPRVRDRRGRWLRLFGQPGR